ncbi:MAG: glutamate-5-semialdehyde dehydrogenase [Acidobacteria bacterium]|nr:glutamate-5-semialdehyde dehydrogenase [Acidobacteriota bacterium]
MNPAAAKVREAAEDARAAAHALALLPGETRHGALQAVAAALEGWIPAILEANAADLADPEGLSGLGPAGVQRLGLDAGKVAGMAAGVRAVAQLPDPLGRVRLRRRLDTGLELTQVTCPLGVLGVVFESRPDALVQISALALKSGNAALLKGGREATRSNRALMAAIQEGLAAAGLPGASLQLLEGRESVQALLGLDGLVDLVIPRGSKALVRAIQEGTRIPVLGHADGICHVFLDAGAEASMAEAIVLDAKTQYPAACNALETLLVHAGCAPALLPPLASRLQAAGVELRGCERSRALVPGMKPATEADWDTEHGELILGVRVVDSLTEAIAHIHAHGSGHTEAIVTEDSAAAERFLREVDAAGVYHNASTRFADGYRYGFGAEVGISTGKLHARGPVGLEGLVTTKYLLRGQGHRVGDYTGPGARPFLHEDLPC